MTYDLLIIAYMGMLVVNECDCTGLRWDVLSFAVLRWDVLSFAVLRWDVLSFAVLLTIYSANSWFCIYFYYIAIIDALFGTILIVSASICREYQFPMQYMGILEKKLHL